MLKQIGKYTISERIGRGINSRVYRAVDSEGCPVAIKVSTTATEPEHLEKFQKDLVAAASVLHPNLVAVHDLGFEDEFPYLVMELVEGQNLGKLLKSNMAPSLAERIRVMQQVGNALSSAHERQVFHLDVRPSKIMLGDDGAAKLLDLGLGRLSFDPARVTEHGYLVGAPFYMSPERLVAIGTANAVCDIWSFGVTFYEWLAGRHPFYDDDGDRMIGNIMNAAPAALSNVPVALNQAILRTLEKDPTKRYRSFAELLADLKPLVGELKREESDALMAEAIKQTNSGRWQEARRIARQMRDLEPRQGPSPQIFGFSDQEMERESQAERFLPTPPPIPSPVVQSALASVVAAAVDTPDPAPPPNLQAPPIQPSAATPQPPPISPAPKPQRPERTAPKIPRMGVRNRAPATSENGSTASARMKPPMPDTNGAPRMAAAAAGTSVAYEMEASTTTEYPPTGSANPENAPSQPVPLLTTVRILKVDESAGFPWVKLLGFAVLALLTIGALLFFLWPASKALKTPGSSEEAKQISHASRVIAPPTSASIEPKAAPASAPTGNAQPGATAAASTTDPLNPTPRFFDPKSLAPAKAAAPPRGRRNGAIAGLAPPPSGNRGEAADDGTLPVALNAPPPPAPAVAPVPEPPQVASIPAASLSLPQTVPDPRESARRVGGVFAQPVLVHTVQPIYPPSAVQRKAQGIVRLQATVAKDGSVKNIQLVSGDPLLNGAAKEAVLQWKYHPAMLNGAPVEVTQAIIVKFNLNQ